MNFYEKIKILSKEKKGLTITEMVKQLGLSTSMPTKWKNGQIPNGETLMKLSNYLEVSIDFLLTEKSFPEPIIKTQNEMDLLIDKLDSVDKTEVKGFVKGLLKAPKYNRQTKFKPLFIVPYYNMPVSAGTGMPLDEETQQKVEIIDDEPPRLTDYVLRVSGDSMEPEFQDNDFVFVQKTDVIEYGDIGIFFFDGNSYIKNTLLMV